MIAQDHGIKQEDRPLNGGMSQEINGVAKAMNLVLMNQFHPHRESSSDFNKHILLSENWTKLSQLKKKNDCVFSIECFKFKKINKYVFVLTFHSKIQILRISKK